MTRWSVEGSKKRGKLESLVSLCKKWQNKHLHPSAFWQMVHSSLNYNSCPIMLSAAFSIQGETIPVQSLLALSTFDWIGFRSVLSMLHIQAFHYRDERIYIAKLLLAKCNSPWQLLILTCRLCRPLVFVCCVFTWHVSWKIYGRHFPIPNIREFQDTTFPRIMVGFLPIP